MELEDRQPQRPRKTVGAAIQAFLLTKAKEADETKRKYKRILGFLTKVAVGDFIVYIEDVNVEAMDRYAAWRNQDRWAWIKEI